MAGQESGEAATTSVPREVERRIGPFRFGRLVGLNIIVAAVIVGIVATRPLVGADPGGGLHRTFDPTATFYPLSLGAEGLEVGATAPGFSGQDGGQNVDVRDLDGRPISLADLRGRPVWIVFWASWCPPCQQETPDLRAVFDEHRSEGLAVIAVSIQEPADAVRAYVERYSLDYTVALDSSGAIARTYEVFGIPTHYFVDRSGVIRDRSFGPLTRAEMERRLTAILPGGATP